MKKLLKETVSAQVSLECAICLSTLVSPITLNCGHTYCEPCIKDPNFRHVKKVCPICRQDILVDVNKFRINVTLDKVLKTVFEKQKNYLQRVSACKKLHMKKTTTLLEIIKNYLKLSIPWILILLLFYHLVRVKLDVWNYVFEKYRVKAMKIADSIKPEDSLDFKLVLFSQFFKILFTNLSLA